MFSLTLYFKEKELTYKPYFIGKKQFDTFIINVWNRS